MTNDFIPVDYRAPADNPYMKFGDGANKFRFLSKPIFGMVYWVGEGETRAPHRKRMGEVIPALGMNKFGKQETAKHFWAAVVWSYEDKQIQILEITQKTVIASIADLARNDEWGDPRGYDLLVTRSGEGLKTEYKVMPYPAKPTALEIDAEFKSMNVHLEALYVGQDPFNGSIPTDQTINPDEIPW